MPYSNDNKNNIPKNNDAPGMVCPVCGKQFYDVRSFAAHMMDHSEEEERRKAEEERNNLEAQRKHDLENLELLYAQRVSAEKKYENARQEYSKKYGGIIVPASYKGSITDLFDKLFF